MPSNYYGTVSALAWALGHHFYGRQHWAFVAPEYYTYRRPNPQSSNPHFVYQLTYQAWKDRDNYDKQIAGLRMGTRTGVIKKGLEGKIDRDTEERLKRICDEVDVVFFYPLVLRVNVDSIERDRLKVAGSGLTGSNEYLIESLKETEIDEVLFLDFDADSDFKRLVYDQYYGVAAGAPQVSAVEVIGILERRCASGGLREAL